MPFQGKHSPTSACGCDRSNVLSKQEPKEGLLGEEQRPPEAEARLLTSSLASPHPRKSLRPYAKGWELGPLQT